MDNINVAKKRHYKSKSLPGKVKSIKKIFIFAKSKNRIIHSRIDTIIIKYYKHIFLCEPYIFNLMEEKYSWTHINDYKGVEEIDKVDIVQKLLRMISFCFFEMSKR